MTSTETPCPPLKRVFSLFCLFDLIFVQMTNMNCWKNTVLSFVFSFSLLDLGLDLINQKHLYKSIVTIPLFLFSFCICRLTDWLWAKRGLALTCSALHSLNPGSPSTFTLILHLYALCTSLWTPITQSQYCCFMLSLHDTAHFHGRSTSMWSHTVELGSSASVRFLFSMYCFICCKLVMRECYFRSQRSVLLSILHMHWTYKWIKKYFFHSSMCWQRQEDRHWCILICSIYSIEIFGS